MAVYQKVGSFQLHTTTGTQTIGGLGFQPKAIIFFHTPDTVDITTQTANFNVSYGLTDGTNQYAFCEFSPNGNVGNESNYVSQWQNHCIAGSVDNTAIWLASIVSLNSDGFTINISSAPSLGYRVGYLAIGGVDVDVAVGSVLMNGTSQSVTGLGFQPTGIIGLSAGLNTWETGPSFGASKSAHIGFGFSDGLSSRSNAMFLNGYTFTTVKQRYRVARNDYFLASPLNSSSYAYTAGITSFDVDGFTMSTYIQLATRHMYYLAIGGAQTKVADFLSPTVTGSFSLTSIGFTPNAVLMSSTWQTAFNVIGGTAIGPGGLMSSGMATASLEQLAIGGTTVTSSTSVEAHHSHSLKLMRRFNANPFTSLEVDFALSAFTPGQIDLLCSTANATTSVISYMAIEGDGFIPPPPVDPTGGSGGPDSPDSVFLLKYMGI